MKTPPLLLAAGLLLWGWQTGHWGAAVALAVLGEAHRYAAWRWDLQERDFQRVADLSSVLFLALVALQFTDDAMGGIYRVLEWMPTVLAPLLLAQLYSRHGTVPASALFASLRRTRGTLLESRQRNLDLSYPYLFVCVLAASTGSDHTPAFAFVVAALLAWCCWAQRPRTRPVPLFLICIATAVGAGLAIQSGLYAAQGLAGSLVLRWMRDPFLMSTSPDRAFTAIGMVGRLKLSDRIRLRVRSHVPLTEALLLREASYSEYRYGTWRSRQARFTAVDPQPDGHTWRLAAPGASTRKLRITAPIRKEVEVIPLPHGMQLLQSADIIALQQNDYGTVMVDTRPGYLQYEVEYADSTLREPPPGPQDLLVPESYRAALTQVTSQLPGTPVSTAEKVAAVEAFFRDNFTYSLVQRGRSAWTQPLLGFLLNNRSGHCEYFASATVLLLRHLGIPARYAVGYAVSDYSALERQYVARQRDAHAWVLAYVEDRWRVVDTTPSVWYAEEDAAANPLTWFADIRAWAGYQWSRLQAEGVVRAWLPWLLPLLIGMLLWRLRHARRATIKAAAPRGVRTPAAGEDSEFYLIVRESNRAGYGPQPGETLQAWLQRVARVTAGQPTGASLLQDLLGLHYRYRFDPRGLAPEERTALRSGVADWLAAAK
jgi:transglutaminase-like putative cysteine protease